MPVVICQLENKSGFKWGQSGACFTYTAGNEAARKRARSRAARQGRAIEAVIRRRRDTARRRRDAKRLIVPPVGVEEDYRILMTRRLARLQRELISRLQPALRALPAINIRARGDGAAEDAAALVRIIRGVEQLWLFPTMADDPTASSVLEVASQVDAFTTQRTVQAISVIASIDVEAALATAGEVGPVHRVWTRRNVELITSIERRHLDDVAEAVARTVLAGQSTRDLAREVEERFGISRRRAGVVARDQVGTLNSQITQAKQNSLGIRQFEWSDSGDGRVRPLHSQIDGQIFDWATGHATEGRPGEPIQCRCVAIPVV